MWVSARPVDGCIPPDLLDHPSVSGLLNLVGLPHVNMAGLVIYLMDVSIWKDYAMITKNEAGFFSF